MQNIKLVIKFFFLFLIIVFLALILFRNNKPEINCEIRTTVTYENDTGATTTIKNLEDVYKLKWIETRNEKICKTQNGKVFE